MEVHHHPNVPHNKKHFKEYILEFLMIFLAVALGFFSETVREKISEKHRENDYIVGLINNIKTDTAELRGLIDRNDLEIRGIDSIFRVSTRDLRKVDVQDSIYYYAIQYTFSLHLFQFDDLTLVQLRNAGGYTLIKSGKAADSIALYESRIQILKFRKNFTLISVYRPGPLLSKYLKVPLVKTLFPPIICAAEYHQI